MWVHMSRSAFQINPRNLNRWQPPSAAPQPAWSRAAAAGFEQLVSPLAVTSTPHNAPPPYALTNGCSYAYPNGSPYAAPHTPRQYDLPTRLADVRGVPP